MHPDVIAACVGIEAVVVRDHGPVNVLATAEVVKRAPLVGVQIEIEVVCTLFESRHAAGREFEAFQVGEAMRVPSFEDVSRTLEIDFWPLDESGL